MASVFRNQVKSILWDFPNSLIIIFDRQKMENLKLLLENLFWRGSMKRFYAFAVVLAVAVASAFAWFHQKNSQSHSVPDKEAVLKAVETLPRGFVPNQGQWNEEALFSAPGFFGNTWITKNG
ncbi:MAG: hypothetical protein ACP5P0_06515, partial [Hydrogenobacter sp.]